MPVFGSTRAITGTDTPTVGADDGALITVTGACVVTLTGTSWVAGRSAIAFEVTADAALTFLEGAGVTIRAASGDETVDVQFQSCVATYTAANAWTIHKGVDPGDFVTTANNLSDVADAATARTNLGLAIGTDVQAWAAVLDATTASFTTADETKLDALEAGATADQTGAEIKVAYEGEADTNAYDDAAVSKLAGIEASADVTDAVNVAAAGAPIITSQIGAPSSTPAAVGDINIDTSADRVYVATATASSADWDLVPVTGAQVKALYEGEASAFTDAQFTKLSNIETAATADQTDAEIRTAVEAATDSNVFTDADHTKLDGVEASATADQTGAEIKVAYEGEADTNAYDDAAVSKLAGIEALADVTDATNVAAAGAPIITSGAGAPVSTPSAVGDIYVDTTGDNVWSAAGTVSSADWKQATGAGGGDLLAANNLSDVANAATSLTNLGVTAAAQTVTDDATVDAMLNTLGGASATGTGGVVRATSPTLVTPDLGTPSAVVLTNATGTAASLTVGATTGVEAGADVTDETNVKAALDGATTTEVDPAATDKILILDASDADNLKNVTWSDVTAAAGGISNVVEDVTPQLGAALDAQNFAITDVGDIHADAIHQLGGGIWNVQHEDYGATGDGTTDDTTAVQAAIDACETANGGTVYFPPGTYVLEDVILKGLVNLQGAGRSRTTLQLKNASTGSVLTCADFDTEFSALTDTGGVSLFSIKDMSINGNRGGAGSGDSAVQIYGCAWEMENVDIHSSAAWGLESGWSNAAGGSADVASTLWTSFPVRISNCLFRESSTGQVLWHGPSDSFFEQCEFVSFNDTPTSSVVVAGKGGGAHFSDSHWWGTAPTYNLQISTDGCYLSNCQIEGVSGSNVWIEADAVSIVGGAIYGTGGAGEKGILVDDSAQDNDGCLSIRVIGVSMWGLLGGAVDLQTDGGGNRFEFRHNMDRKFGVIGTRHPTTIVEDGFTLPLTGVEQRPAYTGSRLWTKLVSLDGIDASNGAYWNGMVVGMGGAEDADRGVLWIQVGNRNTTFVCDVWGLKIDDTTEPVEVWLDETGTYTCDLWLRTSQWHQQSRAITLGGENHQLHYNATQDAAPGTGEVQQTIVDLGDVVSALGSATLTDAGAPAATDQVLIKDAGTGALQTADFSDFSGSGDVSKVGTPADSQVGVWTGDGTIEGDAALTFDTTTDTLATGNITVTGTVDSRDIATDGTKLDGIETAATADQTDAEIRTAVEAATDSNVFTDADHTKLNGIETAADVTDATNVGSAGAPIISSGAGAPGTTPTKVGDIYIDTTADVVYVATDTVSSADWDQATGAGGGDLLAANNLSDVAAAATAFANIKQAASTSATGVVELLTTAELDTGTDTTRAATAAAIEASARSVKLDGIEALADVTDTANVTAAGALMDSEVDADIKTLVLPASTTISAFGATLVDDADAATARTTLGVVIGTDVQAYSAANALTSDSLDEFAVPAANLDINDKSLLQVGAIERAVDTQTAIGSTQTLDTSAYGVFDMTMDVACTFTFSNPAASGEETEFLLYLRQDGSGTNTPVFPAAVDWAGGTAPTITTTASALDILAFSTVDAGTTWLGVTIAQDVK